MTLRLELGRARRIVTIAVLAAIVLTFAAQFVKNEGRLDSLTRFFDSDEKLNFPSVIKELALLVSALGVYAISRVAREEGDRWAGRWRVLAVVLSLLALDEMMLGHQSLDALLKRHFHLSGLLHYEWILVYLPLALAVVVCLARFWWNMRPALRRSFAWAGLLFGGGSGLVEVIKGSVASDSGVQSMRFYLTAAASDSLELIGLAILVLAVLDQLARRPGEIAVRPRA